jgi:phosphohistidine phosphatase
MTVFLVRHTHAADAVADASRPLSARGRGQAARLAAFLKAGGAFAPAEFWHSPLRRARETAELLAAGTGSPAPLRVEPGLEPDEDPAGIAARLAVADRPLALVGHEPHLGVLAALLVRGAPWPPVFQMGKGAVVALERSGEGPGAPWIALWHVTPELLG